MGASTTASDLRAGVLEELAEVTGASLVGWHQIEATESGPMRFVASMAHGRTPALADVMLRLEGTEVSRGAFPTEEEKPWLYRQMSLTRPARQTRNRFRTFAQEVADVELFRETDTWETFYAPAGSVDQARMLLYTPEGAFAGWLGAMTQKPLSEEARKAVGDPDCQRRVWKAMVRAHRLDVAEARCAPLPDTFLCDRGGDVLAAIDPARGWAAAHRSELRAALASVEGELAHFCVGGVVVVARRLHGIVAGADMWSCQARALRVATLDPVAELSPRQREVAEYAANGATLAQIADTLGISPATAKTHLAIVYRRLHVGSRVELAEVLGS